MSIPKTEGAPLTQIIIGSRPFKKIDRVSFAASIVNNLSDLSRHIVVFSLPFALPHSYTILFRSAGLLHGICSLYYASTTSRLAMNTLMTSPKKTGDQKVQSLSLSFHQFLRAGRSLASFSWTLLDLSYLHKSFIPFRKYILIMGTSLTFISLYNQPRYAYFCHQTRSIIREKKEKHNELFSYLSTQSELWYERSKLSQAEKQRFQAFTGTVAPRSPKKESNKSKRKYTKIRFSSVTINEKDLLHSRFSDYQKQHYIQKLDNYMLFQEKVSISLFFINALVISALFLHLLSAQRTLYKKLANIFLMSSSALALTLQAYAYWRFASLDPLIDWQTKEDAKQDYVKHLKMQWGRSTEESKKEAGELFETITTSNKDEEFIENLLSTLAAEGL